MEPGTSPAQPKPRNPLAAGGWSGLSFLAANAIGLLVYPVLSRRLEPDDFGLFTQANLVYLALVMIAEGAVGLALVQLQGDRDRLARAALWLSAGLGGLGTALCIAAAPLMIAIYGDRELLPLLLLLAPGVLLNALGAVPHALLARELDFRRKTLPETLSIALGSVAGLVAALAGLGVYSLAVMSLTTGTVSSVAAWWVCRPRPRLSHPDREAMRRLAAFTATLAGGDLALYARLNADYALTGRLLGAGPLGVYSLAWATSAGPQLVIGAFTGRVGYSLFARLQHDRERLRAVFLSGLRIVATAALPVSLGAMVVTPDLVPVALGARWEAAIEPVAVLFALQLVRTVCSPGASLILALGHTRLYALIGVAALPATVAAVLLGTRGGVTGVSAAVLVAVGSTSLVYLVTALRMLNIRAGELRHVFSIAAALTLASLPALAATRALLLDVRETPAPLRLAAAICAGVVAGLLALWRLWPSLRVDVMRLRHALAVESGDTKAG